MTSDDIQPIQAAILGATLRGHVRPCVVVLVAGSAKAHAMHVVLAGKAMPDVRDLPLPADPNEPKLVLMVRPRELVAEALRQHCGDAGDWLAGQIGGYEACDGWLVVVRPDDLGFGAIKNGNAVFEGSRAYGGAAGPDVTARRAADGGQRHRPGRRRRRGR